MEYSSTNETSGQTFSGTSSFRVTSTTSTAYEVNVTESISGESLSYLFKVETDGTVDWSYAVYAGTPINTTMGAEAAFIGSMAEFEAEASSNQVYSFAQFTQYFHVVAAGTGSIPSIDFSYSNYTANSPNESFGYCGTSFTYSEFSVEIGTIQGTSINILVNATIKGTENSTPIDYEITLTGATLQ